MSRGKDNESNITRLLIGAGVGAVLGLAAYGAKKLYDVVTEAETEQPTGYTNCKKLSDDEDSDEEQTTRMPSQPGSSSSTDMQLSLKHQLNHYYNTYARVPQREKEIATDRPGIGDNTGRNPL